jgi:hypothetical protein
MSVTGCWKIAGRRIIGRGHVSASHRTFVGLPGGIAFVHVPIHLDWLSLRIPGSCVALAILVVTGRGRAAVDMRSWNVVFVVIMVVFLGQGWHANKQSERCCA